MKTKNLLLYTISLFSMMSCNQIKEKFGGNSNENLISENTQLNCDYTNLSNQFNVKFVINKDPNKTIEGIDYVVQVLDKNNKVLKTVTTQPKISSEKLDQYKICDQVKSLSTKYNLDKQFNIESFDGNVIIGDYNFDGKDDIAIYNYKNDTKVFYNYFLQDVNGEFVKDKFLSEDTDYFAKKYDVTNKMIVIQDNSSIKKYAYGNDNWILKEEVNDPFPKATKYGVIDFPNSQFPSEGLNIYDNNFKKVGKITVDNGEYLNVKVKGVELRDVLKGYIVGLYSYPYPYYTSKIGLYIKLDMPGDYYLSSLELKSKGLQPKNLIDFIVDGDHGNLETNGITMNVRQSPSANSNLVAQLNPDILYYLKFTGNKKGQWAEVSEITYYDDYYGDVLFYSNRGWVKIISDEGSSNFYPMFL
ncbi:XAC2610-related protein [Empedobacter falsenii]